MTHKQFVYEPTEGQARAESQVTLSQESLRRFAHDVNNPLTIVLVNLEELRRSWERSSDGPASIPLIEEAMEAAGRVEQAVRGLIHAMHPVPVRAPRPTHHDEIPMPSPLTRVLVVDDEAKLLRAIGRILSKDHLVRCCSSATEALEHLGHETYDVILSDVVMPEISGIEFRDQVVARDPRYARRFLFMTGGTLNAGELLPAAVVHKPFTKSGILEAIRSVLSRAAD